MGISKLIRSIGRKKTAAREAAEAVKTGWGCAVLDHPREGEIITAQYYTFRVGATGDIARVEISINAGPWQPCRNSVGYWWYDWAGYAEGRYQAAVRAQAKDGQVFTSEPCKFQVTSGRDGKQSKRLK